MIFHKITAAITAAIIAASTVLSAQGVTFAKPVEENKVYRGEGMLISVLSDGFATSLNSFVLTTDEQKLTKEDSDLLFMKSAARSMIHPGEEAVTSFVSEKIPFAFDYGDGDRNVYAERTSDIGTAMVSLAAGNSGKLEFFNSAAAGEAPEAQVLAMKVYSTQNSKVTAEAISAAISDSILLGADVILMSRVITGGVLDKAFTDTVDAALKMAHDNGIPVICAAGDIKNYGLDTIYADYDFDLPTSSPDVGNIAYPASSKYAFAVGNSVTNKLYSPAFTFSDGTAIPYSDSNYLYRDATQGKTWGEFFDGKDLEYTVINGIGTPEEFALAGDLTGKLAVVERGELSFADKAKNAYARGAVGVIVTDTQTYAAGTLQTKLELTDAPIPVVLVSMADGRRLENAAKKILTVKNGANYVTETTSTPTVNSLSAHGTSPELSLKPDLCIVGTNAECMISNGTAAVFDSTLVSAAKAAGMYAVVYQKLAHRLGTASKFELMQTTLAAMVSSAEIMERKGGTTYSPRIQGGGNAETEAALSTEIILTSNGLHKIELGDRHERILQFKVTASNISDVTKTCTLDTIVGSDGYTVYSVEELDKEGKPGSSPFSEIFGYDKHGEAAFICNFEVFSDAKVILATTSYQLNKSRSDFTPFTFTLDSGESMTLDISVYIDEPTYRAYSHYFNSGFFVEGFVRATYENGVSSLPFIGYCGSFSYAPALDGDLVKDSFTVYGGNHIFRFIDDDFSGDGTVILGIIEPSFITEETVRDAELMTFSPVVDGKNSQLFLNLSLLRTVKDVSITVEDSLGNTVLRREFGTIFRTSGVGAYGEILPLWDGRAPDMFSYIYPEGTYTVTVSCSSPMDGRTYSFSNNIYLDTTKPLYHSSSYNMIDGVPTLSVNAADNMGVYKITVTDSKKNTAIRKDDGTFDITGLIGDYIYIEVFDYAFNSTVIRLKNPVIPTVFHGSFQQ